MPLGIRISHHEKARNLTTKKDSRPFQSLPIPFADRFPTFRSEARNVGENIEAASFRFVFFNLVHGAKKRRSAAMQ
jgi:hypothetical protein